VRQLVVFQRRPVSSSPVYPAGRVGTPADPNIPPGRESSWDESTPTATALSLIPTVNGNTARSFSTHGQQSAAKGSSTTVSRSDIRLIQHFDSSAHGLVRWWRLTGYFPIHLLPPAQGSLNSCLNFDFAILNLFEPSAP
jgi:hypothetical protein